MSFENFGLSVEILRAITEKGYLQSTPIQLQTIPLILKGHDLLAGSQTGTGKTASFTLPILHRLTHPAKSRKPKTTRALILTPTRELAAQIEVNIKDFSKYLSLKSAVIFGGVNVSQQIRQMQMGVDLLVATPGRLLDLISQQAVDLSLVEVLVLDEADRMLNMGFIHDIRKIIALLPKARQNLLFSATFSDEIRRLAQGFLKNPQLVQATVQNTTAQGVLEVVYPVDSHRKRELLTHLIRADNWKQVLVFSRTKHGANRLTKQLMDDGITAAAIHGNKSQGARTKALSDFKLGQVRVLVATDIAARGLDIDQLPYVVNFDLPNVSEDYVHRIGRTGRAGNKGQAISLVCIDEHQYLIDIERLIKHPIPKVTLPEFTPDPTIKAQPIINGRFAKERTNHRPRHPATNQRSSQPKRSFSSKEKSFRYN